MQAVSERPDPRRDADSVESLAGQRVIVDAAIIVLICAVWCGFVMFATGGGRALFYDTFRDTASAENMLAGRIWGDPSIPGKSLWYAPGNPLLMAGIAAATGADVVEVYASSSYWLNGLNLLLLFVLTRACFGRIVGILAVPMLLLGSFWWFTTAAAPMPSIQGVSLNLIGLMCWHRCRRRSWRWSILTGVVLAGSIWHHPLCGVILALTVLFDVLITCALPPGKFPTPQRSDNAHGPEQPTAGTEPGRYADGGAGDARGVVGRMALVAVTAGLLSAPLIVYLLRLPRLNPAPYLYVPNEMLDLRFALHAHAPLVLLFGIGGAVHILRRRRDCSWVAAYLVVGLVGQTAGYLGHFLKLPVPYLLPHEFQYHGQLALAMCAAVGLVLAARASDRRATHTGRLWLPFRRCLVFASIITFVPALGQAGFARHYFIDPAEMLGGQSECVAWIRENTTLDDVFVAEPETGYLLVAGMTGRKCVTLPLGHLNPAADAARRTRDVEDMLAATDEATFTQIARRYKAKYLLIVERASDTPPVPHVRTRWAKLREAFSSADGRTRLYEILNS